MNEYLRSVASHSECHYAVRHGHSFLGGLRTAAATSEQFGLLTSKPLSQIGFLQPQP